MNFVDDVIDLYESLGEQDWCNTLNFKILKAVREELTSLGMDLHYRDIFIARMTVECTADLTEDQTTRFLDAIRKIVRKFYTLFKQERYNDQAIAEMARSIKLSLNG